MAKNKPMGEYGHDNYEWGSKDDFEKSEWEEHYGSRNRRWKNVEEDAEINSKLEPNTALDAGMDDEI